MAILFGRVEPLIKEGIMGKIRVKLFEIWTSVTAEKSFKDISYLELWQPFCSVDWNHLCNFGRRHHEEQSCETVLHLDNWFRSK